jgi:hypothetical protein
MDINVLLRLHDNVDVHNMAFQWGECLEDEKDEKEDEKEDVNVIRRRLSYDAHISATLNFLELFTSSEEKQREMAYRSGFSSYKKGTFSVGDNQRYKRNFQECFTVKPLNKDNEL